MSAGPPCACPPSSRRRLKSRTVREGSDPGRLVFYPSNRMPAVARGDALRAGAQQQRRFGWLREWPSPPPLLGLPPPLSTARLKTEGVVEGAQLALAAAQWKVRSGRRAASAATTHHVMQACCKQLSLMGGPSPRGRSATFPPRLPRPPPPPLDSPQGRRCVWSARMREPLQPGGGAKAPPPPTRLAEAGSAAAATARTG